MSGVTAVYKVGIRVKGKVQGVFYRASAKEKAQSLGITGFVRNRHDGSVQIVAYGSQDQLDALTEWAGSGPSGAVVSSVDVEECRAVVGVDDAPETFSVLPSV